MNLKKTPELLAIAATVAAACSAFSLGAISANAATPSPAEQRYQQDRANCLAGRTAESRKTCLVEAAAARQAARKNALTTPTPEQIAANERRRCETQSGADKQDCLKRAAGIDTTVSGSVAGGGDLKETVTVIPGTPGTEIHPETMPPTAAGPASVASAPPSTPAN